MCSGIHVTNASYGCSLVGVSVHVCLLVTTMSCTKTAEQMRYGLTGVLVYIRWEAISHRGRGSFFLGGGYFPADCKVQGLSVLSQSHAVGGVVDAAFFPCHHCDTVSPHYV